MNVKEVICMEEDKIKEGVQLILDETKEILRCYQDKNALIDKLNSLHEEDFDLLQKKYKKIKSGQAVNGLRKDVFEYLLDGNKLDEQKLEEFILQHRTGKEGKFVKFQKYFFAFQPLIISCLLHKPISEFIEKFVDVVIERLQLMGKVGCTYVNFNAPAEQTSKKYWLAIFSKGKNSPFDTFQFSVEFEDGKIRYGVNHRTDKHYIKGPEERDSEDFDFESLVSFFEENKKLIIKDDPKVEYNVDAVKPVLDNTESQREDKAMKEFSRNIILYGPPGTGKTYNTIDRAVEIITGNNNPNREENKRLFDALREEGKIEFITFHQNYSYEDFMIGIRPDLEEASTLKFRRKEGIFYKICKRAEQNYLQSNNEMKALRPFEEIFSEFIEPLEKEELEIEIKMISGKSSFWITEINPSNLGFRKQSGGTDHTLSIDTIRGLYEEKRKFTSGLRSYYEPLINELWRRGKQTTTEVPLKRYVLIIDEINRANISKVFGELITLLEEDKRLGAENELRISIPCEEKDFGVPSNLYIIGTMNTADKSIALIDIALRRRFKFIGCFPDSDVVKNESSRKILEHINKEIYGLKNSADFLIGHGYFMDNMETSEVLRNKVIPLLMEYFSGKTDIVMGIFEGSEWLVKYDPEKYVWQIQQ